MAASNPTFVRAFHFRVTLRKSAGASASTPRSGSSAAPATTGDLLADGGFQECSGLQIEMDVQDYYEGGRNDAVVRRVGRAKYQTIVLKRGMLWKGTVDNALWDWLKKTVAGERPVRRYDGVVEVLSGTGDDTAVLATWSFERGLPAKIVGPQLHAQTGELAIEELHIAHEGLRLVPSGG